MTPHRTIVRSAAALLAIAALAACPGGSDPVTAADAPRGFSSDVGPGPYSRTVGPAADTSTDVDRAEPDLPPPPDPCEGAPPCPDLDGNPCTNPGCSAHVGDPALDYCVEWPVTSVEPFEDACQRYSCEGGAVVDHELLDGPGCDTAACVLVGLAGEPVACFVPVVVDPTPVVLAAEVTWDAARASLVSVSGGPGAHQGTADGDTFLLTHPASPTTALAGVLVRLVLTEEVPEEDPLLVSIPLANGASADLRRLTGASAALELPLCAAAPCDGATCGDAPVPDACAGVQVCPCAHACPTTCPEAGPDLDCDGQTDLVDLAAALQLDHASAARTSSPLDPDWDGLLAPCDPDDDGDGWLDACEVEHGADPDDPASQPSPEAACACADPCAD